MESQKNLLVQSFSWNSIAGTEGEASIVSFVKWLHHRDILKLLSSPITFPAPDGDLYMFALLKPETDGELARLDLDKQSIGVGAIDDSTIRICTRVKAELGQYPLMQPADSKSFQIVTE